jgi:hypothetical protein
MVASNDGATMESDNNRSGTPIIVEGNTMRNALGRVLRWIAEALDRNLLTTPDFDLDEAYPYSRRKRPGSTDGIV